MQNQIFFMNLQYLFYVTFFNYQKIFISPPIIIFLFHNYLLILNINHLIPLLSFYIFLNLINIIIMYFIIILLIKLFVNNFVNYYYF